MKNEEQDGALQTPAEANPDKHVNYFAEEEDTDTSAEESIEDPRRRHDADSGNDGSSNEMLADERQIDPGNEKGTEGPEPEE